MSARPTSHAGNVANKVTTAKTVGTEAKARVLTKAKSRVKVKARAKQTERAISQEGLVKEKVKVRASSAAMVGTKAAARKVETEAETRAGTKADTTANLVAAKVRGNSRITKVVGIMARIYGTGMHPHGMIIGCGSSRGPNHNGSQRRRETRIAN